MGTNPILTGAVCFITLLVSTFSCDTTESVDIPKFDKDRAFGYLEHQVSIGPRIPGTETHIKAMHWIVERLREHTDYVSLQRFKAPYDKTETNMNNIIASFYPDKSERILLCTHWDSRHHADRDPDSTKWMEPVPGANDGASSVAVLLEIANSLAKKEPPVGIDMAFFDGEDGGEYGDNSTWLLGSRYFARAMPPGFKPQYAILLDMIGDKDLSLSRDVHSMDSAPALWKRITERCLSLDIRFSPEKRSIIDDHIPLIERGIPSVDLIDFDYESWHTISDLPDRCSAESLDKIGRLILAIIYGE